jgi:hypothetical protein
MMLQARRYGFFPVLKIVIEIFIIISPVFLGHQRVGIFIMKTLKAALPA